MNFLISKDGNYILMGNKIASIKENKSYNIKDLHPVKVIEIFQNQSTKLLEQDSSKINDINSIIRGFGNIISEELTSEENKTFLIELELKLKNNLITESIDDVKILMEGIWGWIKDKAGKVWGGIKQGTKFVAKKVWNGVKWVGGKVLDGLKWLWKKGLPWFFDHLRDFVYSPAGIAIDVFLTATGVGEIPILIVFGALTLWEIKELIEKGFSWGRLFNVIFAAIGCIPAGAALAKGGRAAIEAAEAAKGIGGLKGASRGIIAKILETVKSTIGGILKGIGKGFKWVAGLFGKGAMAWAERLVGSAERTILGATEKVGSKIGMKTLARATSKGIKSFIVWSGVNWGIHEFIKSETGKKLIARIMGVSGHVQPGMTPESLVTDENLKKFLEIDNPQLGPITSLQVIKNPNTNDVEKYVINGKEYMNDPNEKKLMKVIPYQSIYNTSTATNTSTNTNSTSSQTIQSTNQPSDDWSDLDNISIAA